MAREQLVKYTAKCPDVSALVDGLTTSLLGTHVCGSAEDHPRVCSISADVRRSRQVGAGAIADGGFGEAEIEHLHPAGRCEDNIRRFQITVDDAVLVGRVE